MKIGTCCINVGSTATFRVVVWESLKETSHCRILLGTQGKVSFAASILSRAQENFTEP